MGESAVGAVFLEDILQLVQIARKEDGGWKLEKFVQEKFPHKFRLLTLSDDARFGDLKEMVQGVLGRDSWAENTSVAIDHELLFVKETSVDPGLPEDEKKKQILWESQQFLPENLSGDYKVSFAGINADDTFVVLVLFRKLVLERIQQILQGAGKTFGFMDVDTFSAMTAIEKLFDPKGRLVGLADVRKKAVQLTFLKDGNYFRSREVKFADSEEDVFESDQNLANLLNKEINRLLLDAEIHESDSPVSQLYVFGERAASELVSALEGGPSLEVKLADPFKSIKIEEDLQSAVDKIENPANWLIGFGAALQLLG
ncbi:competence protein A [bacterium BMS3Abin05]|nr:competence protein A [bacterium BMS3Abin05]GBE28501.1 competence protein A [bacterium BMS3Bbin03]HDL78880.1 hypothetical protein [Bacteroidota bacterium]HDZ10807.1 hypothetical protein [Bacteroidota bacterium]